MIIPSRDTVRIIADARRTKGLFERALHSELFIAVAAPLLILLIWEIVVRIHLLDARFFPAPSSVIEELIVLLQSGQLFVDIAWTLSRVVIGTLLGTIPGVILGILLGLSPIVRAFVQPAISA